MQQTIPTYVDALTVGFPQVQFIVITGGSPTVYEDIEWTGGDAIPSQDDLNIWIKNNSLTQYQFRQLFTMAERVAIDNAQANPNIPADYKANLVTVMKDLELSTIVQLNNPSLAAGLAFLAQLGLINSYRPAQILANQPPV
jgi:hypothetical protein